MFPPVGIGNAPWLGQSLIGGFFEQVYQEILDECLVLNEFLNYGGVVAQSATGEDAGRRLPMMNGKTVTFDYIKNRRKVAALRSRPNGIAAQAELPTTGQVDMTALYTHEKASISPDMLVIMRQLGENPSAVIPGTDQAAMHMADLARYIRAHTMRAWEKWCCNLLQGDTFTQVVDGVSETVDTKITSVNIGGNFATASTNIPALLNTAARKHRKQAGNPVDLIIMPDIIRDYIAANDKITAFVNRGVMIDGIGTDTVPQALKNSAWSGARELYILAQNDGASGAADSAANYWSDTKIAMVSLKPASRTLMCGTHPVIRPDLSTNAEDAFTRHMWADNETGDIYVREVAAGMFGLGDRLQITVWNINA